MWLPNKGKCNQIWVLSETYMKHNITPLTSKTNRWPSQNSCLATSSWKQHWSVILHGQLQPNQTHSWDSFLAQLMVMKLVQFILLIVVVAIVVLACQMVHIQTSCGPWVLTNQKHMLAQGPSAAQSSKTINNPWFQDAWNSSAQITLLSMKHHVEHTKDQHYEQIEKPGNLSWSEDSQSQYKLHTVAATKLWPLDQTVPIRVYISRWSLEYTLHASNPTRDPR